LSRWSKRSDEDKQRIAMEQSPEYIAKQEGKKRLLNIRETCFIAKAKAGHEKEMCHACDLRCPGCPFESSWSKIGDRHVSG